MSIKNKLLLYRTIIRPTISYASVAWSYKPSKIQFHRLEVLQTKILRQTFKFVKNNQILRETNIPKLKQLFLHEIGLRTFKKAEEHPNPLVREAADYQFDEEASRRRLTTRSACDSTRCFHRPATPGLLSPDHTAPKKQVSIPVSGHVVHIFLFQIHAPTTRAGP